MFKKSSKAANFHLSGNINKEPAFPEKLDDLCKYIEEDETVVKKKKKNKKAKKKQKKLKNQEDPSENQENCQEEEGLLELEEFKKKLKENSFHANKVTFTLHRARKSNLRYQKNGVTE